jgi:hypothetical protein
MAGHRTTPPLRLVSEVAAEYINFMYAHGMFFARTIMPVFLLAECAAALAQPGSPQVLSAKLENILVVPKMESIHVDIRNTGERPITAFSLSYYRLNANGESTPCGGRGADMIDWSDPMPGRNLYVHMRRNWIPPNGTHLVDGYPRCSDGSTSLESIHVDLDLILFEDGTGEGDARRIQFFLRSRQQASDERAKWIDRLSSLRSTPYLKTAAQSLYQDLVDAARAIEINPDDAVQQGNAKPVREEMQRLALEITQWAVHNESLEKNEFLQWRITDLEQRTKRLVHGAGPTIPR